MTIQDILAYYGNSYKLAKITGICASNVWNWKQCGYVPISMQCRIEQLTEGKLKADLNHCKKGADK